ncbi:hypothetical protein QQ045_001874 [Rhodiola kirilowii]
MKQCILGFLIITFLAASVPLTEPHKCKPSGVIKGKKPPKECNTEDDSGCCKEGALYKKFHCSPYVSRHHKTHAILTLNSFQSGGDGGGPSECDGKYHSDHTPVVALSTGWFNNMKRCHKFIEIHANGKTVKAKVVDECDSTEGCDADHAYQPPCANNIVDASKAVWEGLGVKEADWGWLEVEWSDA